MNQIQAEKIDQILHLVDQMDIALIHDIRENTEMNDDEIEDLISIIDSIKFRSSPIATIVYHSEGFDWIQKTYNTSSFLSVGGCIEYYRNLIEEQKKQNELKELEKQKLLNDIASFRITKKQYIWNKIFAIAGFILGLISFLWQILKNA